MESDLRLDNKSRMSREVHVRFREGLGVRFPRATRRAVFAKSPRAAQRIMASVSRYLTDTLRLVVNQQKSRVVTSEEFEFLGFAFVKSRATINVAAKSIRKFKHRIREITGRSRGISMERRLTKLRRYVRGWMGHFGLASQLARSRAIPSSRAISAARS